MLEENVQRHIVLLRGHKVMISTQLAKLYGVEARVLVQAVKRNKSRFPGDFMFQLTKDEFERLKSHIVTSSWGGVRRATPYAFTEQGVAMLSSVLNSKRAIQVNIQIMRAFVRLRQMIGTHKGLAVKLAELEQKIERQDEHIRTIFEAIKQLMAPPHVTPRRKIGFHQEQTFIGGHLLPYTQRDNLNGTSCYGKANAGSGW